MTKPVACPPAPGPLEEYVPGSGDLFTHVAQRRGFREYLAGLLAPRERNKTLTALAGAEPVTGSKLPAVVADSACGDQHHSPAAERGGPAPAGPPQPPCWPRALRAVRAWLAPWIALRRWRAAWSNAPPPPQLQALMTSLQAGHGLHLYIPN